MRPQTLRNLRPAHRAVPVPQTTLYDSMREVDALAGYLQQDCGVRKGDRVILYMQNSPQWVIAYYAILRADAVVVPVNPMNLSEELAHYVTDASAKVALLAAELVEHATPLMTPGKLEKLVVGVYGDYVAEPSPVALPELVRTRAQVPNIDGVVAWSDAIGAARQPGPHLAGTDDMAVMPYTSGTTGKPKGCVHTHGTLMAIVGGSAMLCDLTTADVVLAATPFFHITGMQIALNSSLYNACTVVVMTRWDREAALDLIEQLQITNWNGIPSMVIDLLGSPNATAAKLASLLVIHGGGMAMPEAVATRLNELTGLSYIEGYGLTETAAPTHTNPINKPKRQCLGIPIFNTDCRIIDQDTLQEVPAGEVGEIVSLGPQIFKGYWSNPEATASSFVEIDGKRFFRTGDLARRDEEGYFFMVDRLKRMINASGYKIWPAEVESMMYAHPDVHEACVVGTHDPKRGETVKVIIVLKPGQAGRVTEDAILAWARLHMAAYKAPRIVEFVDSLPKSGTGKVLWRALQERELSKRT